MQSLEDMMNKITEDFKTDGEYKLTPQQLINKYEDIDLEISKLVIEKEEFIKQHAEIFDKVLEIEDMISRMTDNQSNIKSDLKEAMKDAKMPDVDGRRFTAHYTASYTKKNFNTKKFYEDYAPETDMYKKYVGTTNVSDSVSIKEIKKK